MVVVTETHAGEADALQFVGPAAELDARINPPIVGVPIADQHAFDRMKRHLFGMTEHRLVEFVEIDDNRIFQAGRLGGLVEQETMIGRVRLQVAHEKSGQKPLVNGSGMVVLTFFTLRNYHVGG